MHITKEDTGALTASIKLTIGKDDYEEKVSKTLKDYQRKANMPGFRPGKVPFGLVSKMYRKGVLLDEINHLIAENVQTYIEESKLKLIGNPIPNKEKAAFLDLDTQSDFEFYFDIGLAPEFQLDLSENFSVDYLKIKATEKMIDDQVHELQHRAVNHKHHEEQGEEHAEEETHHEELPELNEMFFSQVFPGEEIKDEPAFRSKIREAIEQSLVKESERFFLNSVIEKLVKETRFELPDEFIRKMIRENNEQQLTEEQLDAQYPNFASSVRWQLIESRLIGENNLRVDANEMRNVVKSYFTGHLSNTENDPEHDERLNKIVDSVLSNKEEANRLHDQLFDQKLLDFFKSRLKLNEKEVDYDEFVKMVTQKKE
ncbi:MAG: trigger factor family protein [Bacteroidales bacterium]|jgi:FKBP-type peptidyl-prolyl cis-trans isomerase (trigger factor)|nr:trigger factor family protein [Bacteroidales bacterium]